MLAASITDSRKQEDFGERPNSATWPHGRATTCVGRPAQRGRRKTMAFDKQALEALRGKYGESHGGELFNPQFRRVADKIFTKGGTRLAPYSGIPTFLTAPYMPVDNNEPDFGNLQVA